MALTGQARAYARAYYAANRERLTAEHRAYRAAHLDKVRAREAVYQASHRNERKTYMRTRSKTVSVDLRALKLLRGCFDCGYDANADALQFDHVRGVKVMTVHAAAWDPRRMIAEINKCEVRCANCHAIVTQERRRALAVA